MHPNCSMPCWALHSRWPFPRLWPGSRRTSPATGCRLSPKRSRSGRSRSTIRCPANFLPKAVPVSAPAERRRVGRFRIMARQVSAADYGRCVASGDCKPADNRMAGDRDVPVTGVNYLDATAYAAWYSRETDQAWRLPTAEEAAAAAGERFSGDAFSGASEDPSNPAVAWIRRYREEAATKRPADPLLKPRGFTGQTRSVSRTLAAMSGNGPRPATSAPR